MKLSKILLFLYNKLKSLDVIIGFSFSKSSFYQRSFKKSAIFCSFKELWRVLFPRKVSRLNQSLQAVQQPADITSQQKQRKCWVTRRLIWQCPWCRGLSLSLGPVLRFLCEKLCKDENVLCTTQQAGEAADSSCRQTKAWLMLLRHHRGAFKYYISRVFKILTPSLCVIKISTGLTPLIC